MTIRVRAKARGFYGNSLREAGDTFTIQSEAELGSWMEKADATEGEKAAPPADEKQTARKGK